MANLQAIQDGDEVPLGYMVQPHVEAETALVHHFAFHLGDWNDILKAGDIFSMDDVPIDIGPTRHGIPGHDDLFLRPVREPQRGLRPRLPHPTSTITWTEDQLGKGIFYITRELNDRFTTVFT